MLVRLLVRGHARVRWRRYVVLACVFAIGLVSFFGVLTLVGGAKTALVEPLRHTIAGPLRVTNGTTDLSAGTVWEDYRTVQSQLERALGATAVPRYESNYITIRGTEIQRWSAGLLVGIEPSLDPQVADLARYLVWGRTVESTYVYDAEDAPHVPILLGSATLERLNLTLSPEGRPDFGHPLTITSGHSVGGSGPVFPLTIEAVVVGIFHTGLEPLDKFSAFIPIQHARYLAGHSDEDPVANALLVASADPSRDDRRVERELGYLSMTSDEYALTYMGSMLVVLYAASTIGLLLFVVLLLVWIVHETSTHIRADQPVLCSLRALGIPSRSLQQSYVGLLTLSVAAGALAAFVVAALLLPVLPDLQWSLSGLHAGIDLDPDPLLMAGVTLGTVLVAWLSCAWTARRVARLNILDGLRRG